MSVVPLSGVNAKVVNHGRVGYLVVLVPRHPELGQPVRLEGGATSRVSWKLTSWNAKLTRDGALAPNISPL